MTKHIFRVPVDTKHFEETVIKGVDGARYWGSVPTENNSKTYERMQSGDEILFYRGGKYVAVATIDSKVVDAKIARESYGDNVRGETWSLLYFLRDVKPLSLYTHELNEQWGLKPGPVMGFSKLSDERLQPWLEKHGSVAQFLWKHKVAA